MLLFMTPQDLSENTIHFQANILIPTNCVALIATEVRSPRQGTLEPRQSAALGELVSSGRAGAVPGSMPRNSRSSKHICHPHYCGLPPQLPTGWDVNGPA